MKKVSNITIVVLLTIIISVLATSCDPYEREMAKYAKIADGFKATLDPSNRIIAERIDSVAKKVFYLELDSEGYGDAPITNIKMHDYVTNETKSILPESIAYYVVSDEDFECFQLNYEGSKLIGDRLFLLIHTDCMFDIETTLVFYTNICDNSLHFVAYCDTAEFDSSNGLLIHRTILQELDEESLDYTYSLSAWLSDEEYAAKRIEQVEEIERLEEEWRINEEIKRKNEVRAWLIGTWESSGWDEWIGRYTSYVCITENNLRFGYNGQDIYNGPYEIDMESHNIIFDRHDGYYTRIGFNPRTQRLEDETGTFRKVSNNAGYSSSNSSSYGSGNGNGIAEQLAKLDDEEDKLIREGSNAVRSGRADVALMKVYRMKDINTERIRLARQSGDSDLIQYYESKKMRSEATIRSWGF